MPYIPKKHEKYNLLPMCRKNGREVFEYPRLLLSRLEELGVHHLDPYGYQSYEEYYAELDKRKSQLSDAAILEAFDKFKNRMPELNQKEKWSVLKYVGENTDSFLGLTKGRYYYWPCAAVNASYSGVIDDEEYTAYQYPTEPSLWEIAEDPTGMAHRTIFDGKDAISKKEHELIMRQAESVAMMEYIGEKQ